MSIDRSERFLVIQFRSDGTFKAKMNMDRLDALTVISALKRGFNLEEKEIELSDKLDRAIQQKGG